MRVVTDYELIELTHIKRKLNALINKKFYLVFEDSVNASNAFQTLGKFGSLNLSNFGNVKLIEVVDAPHKVCRTYKYGMLCDARSGVELILDKESITVNGGESIDFID